MKEYIGKWWKHPIEKKFYYFTAITEENKYISYKGIIIGLTIGGKPGVLNTFLKYPTMIYSETFLDKIEKTDRIAELNRTVFKFIFRDKE